MNILCQIDYVLANFTSIKSTEDLAIIENKTEKLVNESGLKISRDNFFIITINFHYFLFI